MAARDDVRERIDRSFGEGPGPGSVDDLLARGHRALARRRLAAGVAARPWWPWSAGRRSWPGEGPVPVPGPARGSPTTGPPGPGSPLGLSVAETAAELRISEGTVKSHTSRGIAAPQSTLEPGAVAPRQA